MDIQTIYPLHNNKMKKQEILAAFNARHACKIFDSSQKITDEDFQFILETARLSPTSFGFEPFHLVVVQSPELREKLKENAWGATVKLDTASHFVICLGMKSPLIKYDSKYLKDFMQRIQKLDEETITMKGGFFEEFQKTGFDLNTDRALFDWACKQSYIVLGNMMSAAAMIGIDSCPIEGFNRSTTDSILEKELGIDLSIYGTAYMVAFGYRKQDPEFEKTRRPIEEIVTWI